MVAQTTRRAPWRFWAAGSSVLLGAALVYHLPALALGIVPAQDDTDTFYFPLLVATTEALQQGQVRLWTPLIFGGYPLFADGEAGMLYPLNLLVLPWTSPEQAFVVLRVVHSLLASLFTFLLLRVLGVGVLGGMVGGLVYAYSGFAAGQVVHANVVGSMAWLPLELALAERMCQAQGVRRLRYAALTGAGFGVQALALHVHITLLSALAVGAFVAYRWVAGRGGTGGGSFSSWFREGASLGVAMAIVGTLGVGLGAVQLLPLLELAEHTYRAAGLPGSLSTPNSISLANLATLLLPHLYDVGIRDYWGPWVKWETTIYVGVLPIILAAVGIAARRGRYRLFFAGLAVLSVLLALGPHAPVPLWDALHGLPGFNVLKSPGRFSLLLSLAVAVGAGYGADWLATRRAAPRWAAAAVVGSVGAVALTALALGEASARLERWATTGSYLFEQYLRVPGVPGTVAGDPLTMYRAAQLAAAALSPENPRTAWQLALGLGGGLAVSLWLLGPGRRPLGALATVVVLFADLWVMGLTFHPFVPLGDLRPHVPSVLAPHRGQFRVLTNPTPLEKTTQVDPNRLMAAGIEEASGYSSLQPDRHAAYLRYALQGDDDLLNAWNVRYIVRHNRPDRFPSYEGVSFHPTRPIFWGKDGDRGRTLAFLPDGGRTVVRELRVVAALADAERVAEGAPVARITVGTAEGEKRSFSLQAGRDVSDATLDAPGYGPFGHGRAEVAFQHQRSDPEADRYGHQIYVARRRVDPPLPLEWLEVEQTAPSGRLLVYGLAAFDAATGEVTQVWTRRDRPLVYRDREITIQENLGALPRAFLVPDAVVLPPEADPLLRLHEGPFDPTRMVVLEEPVPPEITALQPGRGTAQGTGSVRIVRYEPERVVTRTDAPQPSVLVLADAYFPGWVARVDGRPEPVLRANYLFRAVAVPAGEHEVAFSYEPASVAQGLGVSLVALAALSTILGADGVRTWRSRRRASVAPASSPGPDS